MDNEKQFAIKLADNDKTERDRAIRKLRNYIQNREKAEQDPFNEEDMIKMWKGLHYCMWMCDKSLIQEELASRICSLIECFNDRPKQVMLFIKVYFTTIVREWNGIDKWRIDKFMMLMRNMLNAAFRYLSSKKWNKKLVKKFHKFLMEKALNINDFSVPDGVTYHLTDIYLEELGKHGETLKPVKAVRMIIPFFKLMALSTKKCYVEHAKKRIFEQIIECSDVGIDPEVEHELEETKAFGLQLGEPEDTSEYVIPFKYNLIANKLFKTANSKFCLTRNKKVIYDLVKKFRALEKGVYPIDSFNLPPLHENPKRYRQKKREERRLINKQL